MKALDSKQEDIKWGQGVSLPLAEVAGQMNVSCREKPPKFLSSDVTERAPRATRENPTVLQGHPSFSERDGKVTSREKTPTTPQARIPGGSGSSTAHPQPQLLQWERGGRYLQWFEPFQSGVRSGVE